MDDDAGFDEDEKTPLVCVPCGGEFVTMNRKTGSGEYRIARCRWCTNGSMDEKQFKKWQEWAARQKIDKSARPTLKLGRVTSDR